MGLLALLSEQPMYGAQLKHQFETRTGGTVELNIGQVYTTLARLERDGLVQPGAQPDAQGRIAYALTEAGHTEVQTWWSTPVQRSCISRDELEIKLALALANQPREAMGHLLDAQRGACMTHLQNLHAASRQCRAGASETSLGGDLADPVSRRALLLTLDHMIFSAEAEVKWIDHVQTQLRTPPALTAETTPAAQPEVTR